MWTLQSKILKNANKRTNRKAINQFDDCSSNPWPLGVSPDPQANHRCVAFNNKSIKFMLIEAVTSMIITPHILWGEHHHRSLTEIWRKSIAISGPKMLTTKVKLLSRRVHCYWYCPLEPAQSHWTFPGCFSTLKLDVFPPLLFFLESSCKQGNTSVWSTPWPWTTLRLWSCGPQLRTKVRIQAHSPQTWTEFLLTL